MALDARKQQAMNSYDAEGMPTHAVIFSDGMTKMAGDTPKYGKRMGKGDTAIFENRVFGVEVYCGKVHGEVLIHTGMHEYLHDSNAYPDP